MTGFKLFRCTDDNAPVLSGTRGSLINLLRKCLIDGYGTKTPASGWSLEFINATEDVAVFRNDQVSGTGSFMRIDEATSTYSSEAIMSAFEIMTDLDNGSGVFGTGFTMKKSTDYTTNGKLWFLFVSQTMLHLVIYQSVDLESSPVPTTPAHFGVLTFGDFIPYRNEAFPALLGYSYTTNTTNLYGIFQSGGYATGHTPRDYLSTPNTPKILHGGILGPSSPADGYSGVTYNGKLLLAKIAIQDPEATNWSFLRGYVPGIFHPCHPADGFSLPFLSTYDGPGETTYIVTPWKRWSINMVYCSHLAFEFDTE